MFNIKSFTIFVAFQVAALASQEVGDPLCPSIGLSYLPHYANCSLFFECLNGNKVLLRCPADFAWSIPQNKCVPVEEADCSYTTVAPPDDQTCPATGISFLPHYSDCTKFFECVNGNKQLRHCPDEFAWSRTLNKCVIQLEADCSYTTTAPVDQCPSDGISYLPVYSNCRQYIRCDEGVKTVESCDSGYAWSIIIQACDLEELVDCSYTDCPVEGLHYFPVYTNCQQYMKCNYGTKSIETCPDEYAWSTVIQACDLQILVDCSERPLPTSKRPTVPTTATPTTSTKPTTINPNNQCYRQPEGAFFPHPTDCTKYIECTHDQAVVMHCPSSTTWNEAQSVCDYNYETNCAGYSTTKLDYQN